MKATLFFLLALAAVAPVAALPPVRAYLVADLDATPNDIRESTPASFRRIGNAVYFNAQTPETGREPYRTDGTPGGWRLLADLAPGTASSDGVALGEIGGRLILHGNLPGQGAQLWAVDAGGVVTKLASTAVSSATAIVFGTANGRLFVNIGGRLWVTDGTAAGTYDALAAAGFPVQSLLRQSCMLPNAAVFLGRNTFGDDWIVASDGTAAGTRRLVEFGPSFYEPYAASAGGRCYFLSNDAPVWTLFASDGTAQGTAPVATGNGKVVDFLAHDDRIYFASTGSVSRVMRVEPGAPDSVSVVKEVETYYPYLSLATAGGKLVALMPSAAGQNPSFGLFAGDGTPGAMTQVYPTAGAPLPSAVEQRLLAFGDAVVFDTQVSTRLRVDVLTGASQPAIDTTDFDSIDNAQLGAVRIGSSYFGSELMRSDGSVAGTVELSDLWPSTDGGLEEAWLGDNGPILFGDVLVFASRTVNEFQGRLTRTDGTGEGTRRIATTSYTGYQAGFARFGDGVAFMTHNNDSTARLYRVDTALAATTPVADVSSNGGWSFGASGAAILLECRAGADTFHSLCAVGAGGSPVALTGAGQSSDFQVLGDIGGGTIVKTGIGARTWRTDGTAPGTYLVAQGVQHGPPGATNRYASAVLDGRLFFVNCPRTDNCVLVSTDGTPGGTTVLRDLSDGGVETMVRVGSRLLFNIRGAVWSTDGTPGGTDLIYVQQPYYNVALSAVGDVAHVAYQCDSCKFTYLVTDGTALGTRPVALPPNLEPNGKFVAALGNDIALFSCYSQEFGEEVCMTDRGGNEFRVAADLFPGSASSKPQLLAATPNGVHLTADDGRHGRELWRIVPWTDAIFADGFGEPQR
jgi:ELWxxDGT repeat protein